MEHSYVNHKFADGGSGEPEGDDLKSAPSAETADFLVLLVRTTRTMSALGLCLVFFTAINLADAIFMLTRRYWLVFHDYFDTVAYLATCVGAVSALCVLILAACHDILRRRGESVFDEISDELHAKSLTMPVNAATVSPVAVSGNNDIDAQGPKTVSGRLSARIALRSFTQASELPLLPTRLGAAIYIAANILLIVVQQAFLRL